MAGLPRSSSDKLEAQRLKTKINLRIQQTTRVNREHFHLFAEAFIYSIFQGLKTHSLRMMAAFQAYGFDRSMAEMSAAPMLI